MPHALQSRLAIFGAILVAFASVTPRPAQADPNEPIVCQLVYSEDRQARWSVCRSDTALNSQAEIDAARRRGLAAGLTHEQMLDTMRTATKRFRGQIRSVDDAAKAHAVIMAALTASGVPYAPPPTQIKTEGLTGNKVNDDIVAERDVRPTWFKALVYLHAKFDKAESMESAAGDSRVPRIAGGMPKYLSCGPYGAWEKGVLYYRFYDGGTAEQIEWGGPPDSWYAKDLKWKSITGKKNQGYIFNSRAPLNLVRETVNGSVVTVQLSRPDSYGDEKEFSCIAGASSLPLPPVVYRPPAPAPSKDQMARAERTMGWIREMQAKGARCAGPAQLVENTVRNFGADSSQVTRAFEIASERGCF